MSSNIKKNGLNVGEIAPDFKANDIYNNTIQISLYRGKKNVLLFFSRYIGCVWCQMFIADIKRYTEILKGLDTEVIVISESKEEVLKEYAPSETFLKMISDPEKKLYKLYKVDKHGKWLSSKVITESLKFLKYLRNYKWLKGGVKGDPMQIPAIFLIGKDGNIKFSFVSDNIAEHPKIERIIEIIKQSST